MILRDMGDNFRRMILEAEPIKMREPLAGILGAFKNDKDIVEYSFKDAIKLAGHPCPTITGAYLCCKKALSELYRDEIPVRGEISVNVYGEPDEGVYGVVSQVFSLITGATPSTGFKGLGTQFVRKDLLEFSDSNPDEKCMRFEFTRIDNGKKVIVDFFPQNIPFDIMKSERMSELMEKVLWDASKSSEKKEFQDLWMEKVSNMLKEKEIDRWIKIKNG